MEYAVQPVEAAASELRDPNVALRDAGYGKAFCRAAFDSLHVAIGGSAKPCCEFKGEIGNLKETSLEELWYSDALKELRAKMLRGERDAAAGNATMRKTLAASASGTDTTRETSLTAVSMRKQILRNRYCERSISNSAICAI